MRRPRSLTREERRLWAEVARSVTPFRGRTLPEAPPPEAEPARPPAPARPDAARSSAPARPALPPLVGLEPATRTRLRRGRTSVDAVLDLHGMRQAEAHDRLIGFLQRSRAAGHTLVLVITGKGGLGLEGPLFEERGVLKRAVPHWLTRPELRQLVLGFETAAPQHGGAGALYVRLRRARNALS